MKSTGLQFVYKFGNGQSEGDPARPDILGGKGAGLAVLCRAGFSVPPGFTISAECCEWVHDHQGEWPTDLREQVLAALRWLEESTERTFGTGMRPLLVAVRSGAAVSMPGMMDTILNCGMNPSLVGTYPTSEKFWSDYADHIRLFAASAAGVALCSDKGMDADGVAHAYCQQYEIKTGRSFPTDPIDSLFQCINAVFRSWNSERAVSYRQHHEMRNVRGTAVNVQMMFPSERSGVLFTVDPNHPASEEMIVEASWGLGEAVVSGAVTPDIYVLDRNHFQLLRATAGDRPRGEAALSESQLCELGGLGKKVAEHLGKPADIEWGWAEGKVALLQARAIRGLDIATAIEQVRQEEIARLRKFANGEHVVWVRHNLGETLVEPTPLTWDIVQQFMSRGGGYGRLYDALGYRATVPGDHGFLELCCGRIFVDPRRAASFYYGSLPFEYDSRELLRDPTLVEGPPTTLNAERADPLFFLRLPSWAWSLFRASRSMRQMARDAQTRFEQRALPKLETYLNAVAQHSLADDSTADLLRELNRRREFVLGEFAPESLLPGFFGARAHARLRQYLVQVLGEEQGQRLATQLVSGLDGDITIEQNAVLYDVAQDNESLDVFLERFGHRATNEMELSQPRWREDLPYVTRMLGGFRAGQGGAPHERLAEQANERRQVESSLTEILAQWGGSSLRERIDADLRDAQRLLPFREVGKYHLMRGYETIRAVIVELGRRWELGADVFYLRLSELSQFDEEPSELRQAVAQRKHRWRLERKLVVGDVIDSQKLNDFGKIAPIAESAIKNRLESRPIAAGVGQGTARVVFDPREIGDLGTGYVLVCPSTDPGWAPLFANAKGLIVERGGVLSHGAIVARDFGIPAVVCENATRRIPDGARVEVDAHTGRITLLDTE